MTPLERWDESAKLWQFYLDAGGSLDPEPDSQGPFDALMPHGTAPAYGRPAYGRPAYGRPAYGRPAYGRPAYGRSGNE
ncbi:MAG: hypothetical protein NTV29_01790 [Planctomycetota bacterium]|nr:hypothetical protein [Planctomycetota bacterium]